MNPWGLTSSGLLIWGLVAHLIADWPLQNDWMANNKSKFGWAMIVHSGIHGVLLAIIFGWVAVPLAIVHALIDTRKPVIWWSKLIRQTQPVNDILIRNVGEPVVLYDIGTEVRFWTDQVFHIACIAIAALIVVSV